MTKSAYANTLHYHCTILTSHFKDFIFIFQQALEKLFWEIEIEIYILYFFVGNTRKKFKKFGKKEIFRVEILQNIHFAITNYFHEFLRKRTK